MQLLIGHNSPETAYIVHDYPYGFRLRCHIRYWLEYKTGKGVRFVSQTSNPKKPGLVWNKPKASTYCRFAGAMYLDDVHHVHWIGLTEYADTLEAVQFQLNYGAAVPPECQPLLNHWVKAKIAYDEHKARKATD